MNDGDDFVQVSVNIMTVVRSGTTPINYLIIFSLFPINYSNSSKLH